MSRTRSEQDFAVAIEEVSGGRYRSFVLSGTVGAHSSSPFEPPFDPKETENILLSLGEQPRSGIFANATSLVGVEPNREVFRQSIERSTDLKEVGLTLYRSLFRDAVGASFRQSLERARAIPNARVRLRLVFGAGESGPDYLAALPWDLLHAPEAQDFMTLGDEVSVIRQLRVPEATSQEPADSTLRVLVAMATPTGLHPLRLDREWESFEQILGKVPGVKFEPFERARIEDLRDRLLQGKFQCLHFMGHGDLDRDKGVGELFFEADDRSPRPISGSLLAANLRDLPDLRLTVLNACHSGALAFGKGVDPFLGVSASLLRAGQSAVVAMQTSVPDSHAKAFSRGFYGALAQGRPTETALFEGRLRMLNTAGERSSSWAVPVLFMAPGAVQALVARDRREETELAESAEEPNLSSPVPIPPTQPKGADFGRAASKWAVGCQAGAIIAAVLLVLMIGWWVGSRLPESPSRDGILELEGSTMDGGEVKTEAEGDAEGGAEVAAMDDPPSAVRSGPRPKAPVQSAPKVPLLPIREGSVALLVYNNGTGAADRQLGRIFETATGADLQGNSILLPQVDGPVLEDIMGGDYSRLSSAKETAWGVESLVLITASRRELTAPSSNLRAVGLSAAFTVISLRNQTVAFRSRGEHTGMGISEDAALVQAADRCTREIVESIKEGNFGG
ncbi:MAG: CHAT domain-containing protein [Deltaproteobacteria bacterium]|nr:CHAT domain-containing protein [Deltaproteobacteria bacterium]